MAGWLIPATFLPQISGDLFSLQSNLWGLSLIPQVVDMAGLWWLQQVLEADPRFAVVCLLLYAGNCHFPCGFFLL